MIGNSTEDRFGCFDSDGDGYSNKDPDWGYSDGADGYPDDPTRWGHLHHLMVHHLEQLQMQEAEC